MQAEEYFNLYEKCVDVQSIQFNLEDFKSFMQSKNIEIVRTGRGWFLPFFLIFILRTFLFEPYQIPSGSMLPGLKVGDFILVKKFTYGIKINRTGPPIAFGKDPELGDVVVFIPPHDHRPFVKRLIGKPGDRITYINKKIYVNGKPINQKLLSEKDNVRIYEEMLNDRNCLLYTSDAADE